MAEFKVLNDFPCDLTTDSIVRYFSKEVNKKMTEWRTCISADPSCLGDVEHKALQFGRDITGLMLAGVLNSEEVGHAVRQESDRIRRETPVPLRNVYRRARYVRLLCGLVLLIATLYCAPRRSKNKRGAPRGAGRRGTEGKGIYPEWSALGISEGASPGLQEEAARLSVLMPSFELSRQELSRRGIDIDVKTTRRLTLELGKQALSSRREQVKAWHQGMLPAGDYLAGKKVAVSIDGGRARTREVRRRGRKTSKGRCRYDTPWREPKLMTLYIVGPRGRIEKEEVRLIDGTLRGPDHVMDLAAFHLHRLGGARAKRVVFIGDGAEWIWNRIPLVIERAGLQRNRCYVSLDPSHALSHISAALNSVTGRDEKWSKTELTRLKTLLLKSRLDDVLTYLESLPGQRRRGRIVETLRYLKERRELMHYARLRHLGLPIGSGSVESAIRRVINLRIKSPGMFWCEENVERVMYLRAQILSGGWDKMTALVKQHRRVTRKYREIWTPTPYSLKDAANAELILKPLLIEDKT